MKTIIAIALCAFTASAFAAKCEYIDKGGKAAPVETSKVPDGASVEAKSVNSLPADIKQKLYDGSMTKCVTCTNNYVICK